MLQLDPITQSALEAAPSPSSRAAAVLASISGAITVTVFDGAGTTKGTGTMTSLGTLSGNVLILSNSSDFTVTETGSPDPATWYIKFENGSGRWMQGRFGLSSQPTSEFRWSLDAWTLGMVGTFANAYATVQKKEVLLDTEDSFDVEQATINGPPIWTGGTPTTLNLPTGSTYNFAQHASDPDSQSLSYSLTLGNSNGYNIDSVTGILTVGTVSQGIKVTVSDGTLSAETSTCTVTVVNPPSVQATKFVYSDGRTGTNTYGTINAALAAAVAGDIIELRNATAGSTVKWQNQAISLTGKNGTASNPITVRVRDGDSVVLRGATAQVIFYPTNCSYLYFEGNSTGRNGLSFADYADWKPLTGGKSAPQTYTIRAYNSHHIKFTRCKIHGGGTQTDGSFVRRDCRYWMFDDCEISGHGTIDAGDLLDFYAGNSVFRNCTIKWGGHDSLSMSAPYVVIRNCLFEGDWGDAVEAWRYGTATARGNRLLGLTPNSYDDWSPTVGGNHHVGITTTNQWTFGPVLVERNTLRNLVTESTLSADPSQKFGGYRIIERGNLFHDATNGFGLIGPDWSAVNTYTGDGAYAGPSQAESHFYHNTMHGFDGWVSASGTGWLNGTHHADEMQGYTFKNNIVSSLRRSGNRGTNVFYWYNPSVPLDGWPNKWKGLELENNLIHSSTETNLYVSLNGTTEKIGLNALWPNNVKSNTLTATMPNYANLAARTFAGMTVTSGTGYRDAVPLTRTTSAGTNTTTLPVQTASMFYDGENPNTWNLAQFGEQNDYIAVGATAAGAVLVQIASISGNTITLKTPISFTSNAGVWFAGNPANGTAKVWYNRGAGQ